MSKSLDYIEGWDFYLPRLNLDCYFFADSEIQESGEKSIFPPYDQYKNLGFLGKGSCGKVQLVKEYRTGMNFALKTINKRLLRRKSKSFVDEYLKEVKILSRLDHNHISTLRRCFQTKDQIYLLFDYISGTEIFNSKAFTKIMKQEEKKKLEYVRKWICQLASIIGHLHKNEMILRELDLDHVILNEKNDIVMVGFPFVKLGMSSGSITIPEYTAPEILEGEKHSFSSDWWIFGNVIYEFFCGIPPYYSENINEIYENIFERKHIKFPSGLSKEVVDLISKLLTFDPRTRLGGSGGFGEIKVHPFFKGFDWEDIEGRNISGIDEKERIGYVFYCCALGEEGGFFLLTKIVFSSRENLTIPTTFLCFGLQIM